MFYAIVENNKWMIRWCYWNIFTNQKAPLAGSLLQSLELESVASIAESSATAAAKIPPRRPVSHRAGFVNNESSSVQFLAIEHFNGFLGFFICGHFHESKTL